MQKFEMTRNYYNGIASGYKQLYHEEQIKKILLIKKFLPSNGNLLDLGAGDGVLNQFINKNVDLISFDISEELLKINSNRYENKIQGNIENLPFKDNHFDFVSSFTVFQDTSNPKKAIRETYRVLNKNGIFILSYLWISKNNSLIENEIFKYFKIIEKIKEEKDVIFILKKEI